MSLFSADQIRNVGSGALPQGESGFAPAAPGHARILLLGLAHLSDFGLIAGAGVAIHAVYVSPLNGTLGEYYLLSFGMALLNAMPKDSR